jgi:hypothetical protein
MDLPDLIGEGIAFWELLEGMLVGADILHFNAGFPSDLGWDSTSPLRASDHDALEGRFKLK